MRHLVVLVGLIAAVSWKIHAVADTGFEPKINQNYTSSREIDWLEIAADDTLWAFTGGGVMRFQNGTWKKFAAPPPEYVPTKKSPQWRGQNVTATFDGLKIGEGHARTVAMPSSNGTHISAILPRGNVLWVAMFGDGLYEWNGKGWSKPSVNLPSQAREITALAVSKDGKRLWLGTRRQGLWSLQDGAWRQHLQPDEPFAHNVQSLQTFGGAIWASTLEDGLVVRDARGWKHLGRGVLSSNAPRQMAVFKDRLYVRHSNEVVDCFDGRTWAKNVFPHLPRKQIISLAADANRLYLGQWGGWSEWDGKNFVHNLRIPELQIVPLMQIFPANGSLWLGTENRGLFEWDRRQKRLRQYDERDGLPDDWITSLHRSGSVIFAGTFNGGLVWRNDKETRWHSAPALKRLGITAMSSDGAGQTLVATRFGLYRRAEKGELQPLRAGFTPAEREIQALLPTPNGLWMGTRNGLLFRTRSTLLRLYCAQP